MQAIIRFSVGSTLLLLSFAPQLRAEEVSFANGDRVTGRIVKIAPGYVLIETAYGPYRLRRTEIASIRFEYRPFAMARLLDGSLVQGFLVWDARDLVLVQSTTRSDDRKPAAEADSTDDSSVSESSDDNESDEQSDEQADERRIPWSEVKETNLNQGPPGQD